MFISPTLKKNYFWVIQGIQLTLFAHYESIIDVHVSLLLFLHNKITLISHIHVIGALIHYNHYWSIRECIHEYLAMYSYSHSNTLSFMAPCMCIRIRIRICIKCIHSMPAGDYAHPICDSHNQASRVSPKNDEM